MNFHWQNFNKILFIYRLFWSVKKCLKSWLNVFKFLSNFWQQIFNKNFEFAMNSFKQNLNWAIFEVQLFVRRKSYIGFEPGMFLVLPTALESLIFLSIIILRTFFSCEYETHNFLFQKWNTAIQMNTYIRGLLDIFLA